MACIASTDKGRIFLAGHNGLIYDLLYTIGSPCRLVCCTPPPPMPVLCPDANEWDERLSRDPASVVDLLKEMRNNYSLFNKYVSDRSSFLVRDFDPVVEMVVDNERKILHARTKEAALKAYFLGMKGGSPIEKLGQVDNLLDHHSPDKAASRTNKLSIVSISPLSSKLESNAHLVAVLSDCTRIYLSTSSSSQSSPNCLRVVTTPNLTIDQRKGLSTKAEIAYCSTLGNCELERGLPEDNMFYSLGDSTILSSTSRYVPSQFMRKRVNIESFRRQEARMCDAIEKRKHAMSKKIM